MGNTSPWIGAEWSVSSFRFSHKWWFCRLPTCLATATGTDYLYVRTAVEFFLCSIPEVACIPVVQVVTTPAVSWQCEKIQNPVELKRLGLTMGCMWDCLPLFFCMWDCLPLYKTPLYKTVHGKNCYIFSAMADNSLE
jgi:hypothetical protein